MHRPIWLGPLNPGFRGFRSTGLVCDHRRHEGHPIADPDQRGWLSAPDPTGVATLDFISEGYPLKGAGVGCATRSMRWGFPLRSAANAGPFPHEGDRGAADARTAAGNDHGLIYERPQSQFSSDLQPAFHLAFARANSWQEPAVVGFASKPLGECARYSPGSQTVPSRLRAMMSSCVSSP